MIVLRDLHSIPEYQQVVDLELAIWGYTDMSDVVTLPMFIITVKRGAILIGAFDDLDRMVGFVYSIVGVKNGKAIQWSHMAGVLPEFRNRGLGRDLKLAQRARAIEGGFDLIEWTFDPLQAANAHLNFAKLGVVSDEYAVNIYGDSSSALHRGTPTDRLVVQWNIREPHVERRIRGSRFEVPGSGVPGSKVRGSDESVRGPDGSVQGSDGSRSGRSGRSGGSGKRSQHAKRQTSFELVQPLTTGPTRPESDVRLRARAAEAANAPTVNRDRIDLSIDERRVWVEIPIGFTEMQQKEPDRALALRMQTREIFQAYFARGYRAVDFELAKSEGRGRYLLAR